jgi:hypothetical protein
MPLITMARSCPAGAPGAGLGSMVSIKAHSAFVKSRQQSDSVIRHEPVRVRDPRAARDLCESTVFNRGCWIENTPLVSCEVHGFRTILSSHGESYRPTRR